MDSAAALEGARRYLSGLQPEDHHGDGVAQPPYRVANPWGQGYDREPRAGASELPSTDPQPRVRCGKAASCKGRSRGLSCMKGNFHVQFLGEGVAATSPPYPTPGWATTQVYPARNSTANTLVPPRCDCAAGEQPQSCREGEATQAGNPRTAVSFRKVQYYKISYSDPSLSRPWLIIEAHASRMWTSSRKAVLSPPALSRPRNSIVCAPAATVNAVVVYRAYDVPVGV